MREANNEQEIQTISNRIFSNLSDLLRELHSEDYNTSIRFCISINFNDCTFENLNLIGWDIANCLFERVTFKNCNLDGAKFFKSTIKNSRIIDCSLRRGTYPILNDGLRGGGQCSIIETNFDRVIFTSCDITEGYIKNCKLKWVEFQGCTLYGCDLMDCKFTGFSAHRCNLVATRFRGDYFSYCSLSSCDVNDETLFEDVADDHDKYAAYLLYNQTYKLYKAQGLEKLSEEHFFLSKKFERVSSENWFYRVWLSILKYSCGYGEKPERVVLTSIGIILFFALFHALNGLNYPSLEQLQGSDYVIKCIYYSAAAFTTLGDGDIARLNKVGMVLTGLETSVGLLLTAIGTASFYKKITK